MKKSILLIVLLTIVTFTFATNVIPADDAKRVSKNFMTEVTGKTFTLDDFTLVNTIYTAEGAVAYYHFQIGEQGFIMISATDLAVPVLAYSLENNFEGAIADNYFLAKYKDEIQQLQAQPALANNHATAWAHYNNKNFVPNARKSAAGVQPMTSTKWSQEKYYNAYCPFDPRESTPIDAIGRDYHALVGCVAVNITNLLYYHRYPNSGVSGLSYIPVSDDMEEPFVYPRQTVNFASQYYNYNAMTDNDLGSLNQYVNQLAQLIFHAGVSTRMSFGCNGSGSNSANAVEALTTYWKMNPLARNFSAGDVTGTEFVDSMTAQLDKNLPVYFSATIDGQEGHAFIVDGYTMNGDNQYFHVNFGWAGYKNGYYTHGNFDGYNADENILLNVFPADEAGVKPATSSDTITAYLGTISDGSGAYKYAPNSERTWLVKAPRATSYTINFSKIKTEAENDIIQIYSGNTPTAANLVGTYSGNYLTKSANDNGGTAQSNFEGSELPGIIQINNSQFLVVFTSNNNDITDYGFTLSYNSNYSTSGVSTCGSSNNLPTIVGSICDKGANYTEDDLNTPYLPARKCSWFGNFTYLSGISMSFSKFDLGAGEYIEIIDMQDPNLFKQLYVFTNQNMPDGAFVLPTSKFRINFISDNWSEKTGFVLDYYGIVGINENSEILDLNVYPNPANDQLNVNLTTAQNENVSFQILDMTGKVISSDALMVDGNYTYSANISNLASGMYMVKVQTTSGKAIHKFIVE